MASVTKTQNKPKPIQLKVNVNQLLSLKSPSSLKNNLNVLSTCKKEKPGTSKGTRITPLAKKGPRSAGGLGSEGKLKMNLNLNDFSSGFIRGNGTLSSKLLPSLGKEIALPRIPSAKPFSRVNSSSKDFPMYKPEPSSEGQKLLRKNYKFQTLNPRRTSNLTQNSSSFRQDSSEADLRSTKGKFPKELFSMISKKKFVI